MPNVEFASNEFTTWNLLEYLTRAYGSQLSGKPFDSNCLSNWVMQGNIPVVYGGNKILKVETFDELDRLRVYTIEHLDRNDIEAAYGSLSKYKITSNGQRAIPSVDKRSVPRKHRTELYYQTLKSANRTIKSLSGATLPENHKMVGVNSKQIKGSIKRKKKDE